VVIAIYLKDVTVPPDALIKQQQTESSNQNSNNASVKTVVTKKKRASRTPSRKSGIERYSRIIEAAESLICEAGTLDGLTLDLIAKRAEVPRVSLYYFFDSIDALVDALYQKGSDEMLAEFPDPPPEFGWRELLILYKDSAREFYLKNPAAMIISLLPTSVEAKNAVVRDFGQSLHALFVERDLMPNSREAMRACEILNGLIDAVWSKSLIEEGTITPTYDQEAERVLLSYMASVLEA
jgi:AcrR family transcriptional regulator